MAYYYMKVKPASGKILGTSTDPQHKDWIELLTWGFPSRRTSGAWGASRSVSQDLRIVMIPSKASAMLLAALVSGLVLVKVVLDVVTGAQGKGPGSRFVFTNVRVTSSQTTKAGRGRADEFTLNYEEIKLTLTVPDAD